MALVIQDYGHGKERDPGATYRGRTESDDVLKLGKKVTSILRNNGVKVIETRKGNEFVSLIERSKISNRNKTDIFISYHRNSFNTVAQGAETYTYPISSSRSIGLAKAIQKTLVSVGFADRGYKTKNLSVLRETKAPSVLIEVGFIDNVGDNRIFDNNLNVIAIGIAKDILDELNIKSNERRSYAKKGDNDNKRDTNLSIRQVQKDLNELGYETPIDGSFGSHMQKTVTDLQRDYKLISNGLVGNETLSLIEHLKVVNLKRGSSGVRVVKLQKDLKYLGYDVRVTGPYGNEVERAITKFQSRHIGVKRDGIADEITLNMIKNDLKAIELYNKK